MKVKSFLISLFFIIGFMDCFSQTKGVVCVYKATPPVLPPKYQKTEVQDEDIWKLYEVRYKNKEYLCEKKQEHGNDLLKEDRLQNYINFNDGSSICQIGYHDIFTDITTKYLMSGKAKTYDWQITTDTMTIDGNLCHKAYFTRTSVHGTTLMYKAWFCSDIPFPIGPYGYCGLPGLIVRLEVPFMIFDLRSIVYSDDVEVQQPKEGKKITSEDYESLVEKNYEKIRKASN